MGLTKPNIVELALLGTSRSLLISALAEGYVLATDDPTVEIPHDLEVPSQLVPLRHRRHRVRKPSLNRAPENLQGTRAPDAGIGMNRAHTRSQAVTVAKKVTVRDYEILRVPSYASFQEVATGTRRSFHPLSRDPWSKVAVAV
jgi:hypothetical protein